MKKEADIWLGLPFPYLWGRVGAGCVTNSGAHGLQRFLTLLRKGEGNNAVFSWIP
jgi:hypothetical protein